MGQVQGNGRVARPDAVRRLRAAVIRDLLRAGWRPPRRLPGTQAERLTDDICRAGIDNRHSRALTLTPHEQRILDLVAEGNTGPQIAERLGRSPDTIKKAEKQIRRKLGARTNAHAVALTR